MKMASKSYKVISLWKNDSSCPVKDSEVLSEKTLPVKSRTIYLKSALSRDGRKRQGSQASALRLPRCLWRGVRYHCRCHCIKRWCIRLTLRTPCPRQNGFDSTQVQRQQAQQRENLPTNSADNQTSLTHDSSSRDLEVLTPWPVTVRGLGDAISDVWVTPMSSRC